MFFKTPSDKLFVACFTCELPDLLMDIFLMVVKSLFSCKLFIAHFTCEFLDL